MEIDLGGRRAIVTGAGRGIGAAIARALHGAGATVVVADRDGDAARALATDLAAGATPATVDVTDEAAVADLFAGVTTGTRLILVNNAGISRPAPTADTSRTQWTDVLEVNLTGAFLCSRAAIGPMRAAGWGRIVNVASMSARTAPVYGDNASYAASKSGLLGLTRNLAVELAPHGVTVNAVAPGIVETELLHGAHSPARLADLLARVPVGRPVHPREVAALVTFLASDHAGAITGETVHINGGMYLD